MVEEIRGLISELCKDDVFHNHRLQGGFIYRYPLVQYKILKGQVCVLGIGRAAPLVADMKLPKTWILGGEEYRVTGTKIFRGDFTFDTGKDLAVYQFISPWTPLSPEKYKEFRKLKSRREERMLLESLLIGNILIAAKAFNVRIKERVCVKLGRPTFRNADYKNTTLCGMYGSFATNVKIPSLLGLGRRVAWGFGSIKLQKR